MNFAQMLMAPAPKPLFDFEECKRPKGSGDYQYQQSDDAKERYFELLSKGEMSTSEIAKELKIQVKSANGMLNKYMKEGFVERVGRETRKQGGEPWIWRLK